MKKELNKPKETTQEMIDKSTDVIKMADDAKTSASQKKMKKKRLFKVSTFHH